MKLLTIASIYPSRQLPQEGRSVYHLDRGLHRIGVDGTTLVLRPWAPRWLARRVGRWQHLAAAEPLAGAGEHGTVVFGRYLHLPRDRHSDRNARFMTRRALGLIRRRGLRFDLVHGQSVYTTALSAFRVARTCGVPFVLTLRDDLSHLDRLLESGGGSLRARYDEMFRHVSAAFSHGPAIDRDVRRRVAGNPSVHVVLAPNGVDVEGIEDILAALDPPRSRPWGRIVSVGNLYRYKGIHENLRALKLLDDRGVRSWRYTIVGGGPYREELRALADDLELADRVRLTGRVSYAEAIRAISEADIFCLPSWLEPFGNVYAEAAVCGKPAIGCRGFGAELTIAHRETGLLVPPKSVPAVADALESLLAHPGKARELGERARRHVRRFTWERTAGLYHDVFEQLLSRKPPGGDPRRC